MYKKDNYYWAKVSYTRVGYEWLIAKYVGDDMWELCGYYEDLPTAFFDKIIDKPITR